MPSLNVVALISGGKDSFYSILHCIQNGHKVVALANLHPTTTTEAGDGHVEVEDLNSYMYQTVGHGVIPLYASALDLPLYRRAISGTIAQAGSYYLYAPTGPLDETEDLTLLLQEVRQHHVEINAICSGAILSTYQRTRIESVAIRLGLIPLGFLWQYPALPPPLEREDSITGLLDDMAAAGCDCRIIKTASGGVRDTMLWANVTSARTRNQLVAAMSPFFVGHEFLLRGSVLGEGGEYETLAINGPAGVWKQRILFEEDGNTVFSVEGGVSYLRLGRARLNAQAQTECDQTSTLVRVPELHDQAFAMLEGNFQPATSSALPSVQSPLETTERPRLFPLHVVKHLVPSSPRLRLSTNSTCSSIAISNMTNTECKQASNQTSDIMKLLQMCIHSLNRERSAFAQLSVDDIVFTLLLLESIKDFADVNAMYGKVFKGTNPPARVTVACGDKLPEDVLVSLSVMLDTSPRSKRRGLHVQSRSYWAPANIGPYSQAITAPLTNGGEADNAEDSEIVHLAGQIPLVPHTMEIIQGTFLQQTILALQHLWRVGQEREVDLWTHGVAYLANQSESMDFDLESLQNIWRIWKGAHEWSQKPKGINEDGDEDDGPDAWDLRNNHYHYRGINDPSTKARKPSGTHLRPLPRVSVIQSSKHARATADSIFTPPLLIAEVDSLPRNAPIEWHSLGLGRMPTIKPRIKLSNTGAGPVLASHCTVLANALEQYADEPDTSAEAANQKTNHAIDTDFVTIEVQAPEQDPQSVDDAARQTRSLSSITSAISAIANAAEWTIAQGTAYVAGPFGWTVLDSLQQTAGGGSKPGWEALAIIPCNTVWAATSDPGGRVKKLDLGLVLRLERP